MSEFTKWIMSVLAVAIIGFTVDLFLSDAKTAKIVRVATAAITLLVLVTPLPSLISDGEINLENFTFIYKTETDTKYAEYIAGQKRAVLAARGLKNAAVKVTGEGDDIFIEINLSDCVIDEKNEHINKNELARSVVCDEAGIDESRVKIYG